MKTVSDAVITISNQLVADPSRPPTEIDGRLTKSVGQFHYSWLAIRAEAEIAFSQSLVTDPEKNFILAELIRFLSHPSAGVEGFNEMPAVWPELINEIGSARIPRRSDPRLIPDTAAEIVVRADLKSRSTRISMTLRAPEDRKRPEARLNWLLNQLKAAEPKGIEIVAHWPGKAKATYRTLAAVREDPKVITETDRPITPSYFEVAQVCHTPASFAGRRRFLQDLETAVQQFYLNVGSRLAAWAPKAPSPSERTVADQIEESSTIEPQLSAVHESLADMMRQFGVSHNEPQVPSSSDTEKS